MNKVVLSKLIEEIHPVFKTYSYSSREKVVNEIFNIVQSLSVEKAESCIRKSIFAQPGKIKVSALSHPMGKAFESLLLARQDWISHIPSWDKVLDFLPSIFWIMDSDLSKKAKQWLQLKITHSKEEVPNEKMRAIYIRNLLSYYPFFHPKKGDELELPFGPLGSKLKYRVEPIQLTPSYLGSPLMAYGLVPKIPVQASPLLLFKGTTYPSDDGFYLSILTDLNPYGSIGSFAFHGFAKRKIEKWLKKNTKEEKAEVMGASLGGSLSLQTACFLPKYIKSVSAFNSPGLTFQDISNWNRNKQKPEVNIYLQDGDLVSSSVGRCFASDWNIFHVFVSKISSSQVHAAAYTAHPESFIIPGDPQGINREFRRFSWPFIQHIFLFPLFLLGSLFLVIKSCFFKFLYFFRFNLIINRY